MTRILPASGDTQEIMRCPGCGAPIPEGKLYCEVCGAEIHFVPEFEPEVDDSINVAMSSVASEIATQKEESVPEEPAGSFVRREDARSDAYFDLHIRFPKRALRYLGIGLGIAAAVTLAVIAVPRILKLEIFDGASRASEVQTDGPGTQSGEMTPANSGAVPGAEEADTVPEAPELTPVSGRYAGELAVSVADFHDDLRYFYTINGDRPTAESARYLAPILLDETGETTVRVIAMNGEGVTSEETIAVYMVDRALPAAPVILEESGEYTQSTMIVVVSQEGCTITYTTDGSDPEVDSAVYTTPIKMPVGNSVFRFRAFDDEGNGSEIEERVYHLAYARLVSEEQAAASVIRVLVSKNVLIDSTGKVLGAEGHNDYIVESVIEIEGAGEYYRIVERYVAPDGSVKDTGLLYAVNTNDGSVHRLGYDSSGRYTLFTLAGR